MPVKRKPVKVVQKEQCEMCHNPATHFVGHPPFKCCGIHAGMVQRRVGIGACLLDRATIRRMMGFLCP